MVTFYKSLSNFKQTANIGIFSLDVILEKIAEL